MYCHQLHLAARPSIRTTAFTSALWQTASATLYHTRLANCNRVSGQLSLSMSSCQPAATYRNLIEAGVADPRESKQRTEFVAGMDVQ